LAIPQYAGFLWKPFSQSVPLFSDDKSNITIIPGGGQHFF